MLKCDTHYFDGAAGKRLRARVVGSVAMSTDSRAVTPRIGSAVSGPKMTRPDSRVPDRDRPMGRPQRSTYMVNGSFSSRRWVRVRRFGEN